MHIVSEKDKELRQASRKYMKFIEGKVKKRLLLPQLSDYLHYWCFLQDDTLLTTTGGLIKFIAIDMNDLRSIPEQHDIASRYLNMLVASLPEGFVIEQIYIKEKDFNLLIEGESNIEAVDEFMKHYNSNLVGNDLFSNYCVFTLSFHPSYKRNFSNILNFIFKSKGGNENFYRILFDNSLEYFNTVFDDFLKTLKSFNLGTNIFAFNQTQAFRFLSFLISRSDERFANEFKFHPQLNTLSEILALNVEVKTEYPMQIKYGDDYEILEVFSLSSFGSNVLFAGALNSLNELGIDYTLSLRYISFGDKSSRFIRSFQKKTIASKQGVMSSIMSNVDSSYLDSSIENTAVEESIGEVDDLRHIVESSALLKNGSPLNVGCLTMTLVLSTKNIEGNDKERVAKFRDNLTKVREIFSRHRIHVINNQYPFNDFLGSLPGHKQYGCSKLNVTSSNFSNLCILTASESGTENDHYVKMYDDNRPLLYCRTQDNTLYKFNIMFGSDVGHTLVLGPTGRGKSVLLNIIAISFLQYVNSKVFYFDVGASFDKFCHDADANILGKNFSLGICPLYISDVELFDEELFGKAVSRAAIYLKLMINVQGEAVDSEEFSYIFNQLQAFYDLNKTRAADSRNFSLSEFVATLSMHPRLSNILSYYTTGPFSKYFSAEKGFQLDKRLNYFELSDILAKKFDSNISLLLVSYVCSLVEQFLEIDDLSMSKYPSLIVFDESWIFLKNVFFLGYIENWVKTLRKFGVSIVFGSQDAQDFFKNREDNLEAFNFLANLETRIFLPGNEDYYINLEKYMNINRSMLELFQNLYGYGHYLLYRVVDGVPYSYVVNILLDDHLLRQLSYKTASLNIAIDDDATDADNIGDTDGSVNDEVRDNE